MKSVNSENPVEYKTTTNRTCKYRYASADDVVEAALSIMESRFKKSGVNLQSSNAIKDWFILNDDTINQEVFKILWLDSQYNMIECETISKGTINQATVYPREVVKLALMKGASACFISHNHPSGALEPSQADIKITEMLKKALSVVDVKLVDHIITAKGSAMSFVECGY